jgi:hypothetical protein
MKRFLLLGLVLAVGLLGLSSCKTDGNAGLMEGTWSLDSTQTSGGARVLGDGNFTLTYTGEITFIWVIEVYTGSGTIGGFDYIVDAAYIPSLQTATISLHEAGENPDDHYIELTDDSYSGGNTMDGDYTGGAGDYLTGQFKDIGEGTFTATQN